jgi:hypothetical protein
MLTAEQIRELLQLRPHPIEGGYFSETYRGSQVIPQSLLRGYPSDRAISTAIYYLLTPVLFRRCTACAATKCFIFIWAMQSRCCN